MCLENILIEYFLSNKRNNKIKYECVLLVNFHFNVNLHKIYVKLHKYGH